MIARPQAIRLAGAVLAGLMAGGAVLSATLGDVLVAFGRVDLASRLPGNAPLLARAQLPVLGDRAPTPESRALATAALETAPLSSAGLTHLALDARYSGDPLAAQRLLAITAATGWHDEFAQRELYNAAIRRNDAAASVRHAEALLRQGKGRDELFATFDRGVLIAPFRKALGAAMAGPTVWPIDYLVSRGARLPDEVLLDLAAARAGKARLERAIAGPLVVGLVQQRRLDAAARLWRMADGPGAAGPLGWDTATSGEPGGEPFAWSLGEGYRIDLTDDRLTAESPAPGAQASRILALPPGRWRLVPGGETEGWRWSFGCLTSPGDPLRPLPGGAEFAVDADCPLQRLSLAATLLGGVTAAPLDPLRLDRIAGQP